MNFRRVTNLETNLVNDENGDLFADSLNILNRWKNYFCQLLNVHGVTSVRQNEIYTNIYRVVDWTDLTQARGSWQCLVNTVMNLWISWKGREFLDQLNNYKLLKKDSSPLS
jgi:hypothetical protein